MKRIISLSMALLMLVCVFTAVDTTVFAASFKAPTGRMVTSVKEYDLAPGIIEKHIVTNNYEGTHQTKAYVAIADFSNPNVGFFAGYKDYDSSGRWGMQTVRDQAHAAEEVRGVKVVAGINADYYCMTDGNPVGMKQGEPYGALIMDGKVVHSPEGQPHYFAVLNDGTPVIRNSTESWDDVKYAIGAPLRIVVGGAVVENPDTTLLPRCALGITADNKVIIYTADGRQAPISVGESVTGTAEMMKALGCVEAVYLDGGGSATYASKSITEDGMTVKNKPSDGTERKVSTTALLYYGVPNDYVPEENVHTHVWTDATCTAAKTCSDCGETEGEALGHKEVVLSAKAATYKAEGLTEGKKCSVCGVVTVAQNTVARKTLAKVTGLKVKSVTAATATLSWKKVTGAESYTVSYSTDGKKWKTTKATKNSVTIKKLSSAKNYQFKVKAVAGKYSGANSAVVKGTTLFTAATLSSVKSAKKAQLTVAWKQVKNASGYVVEYSTSKKFTKKTTKSVTIKKGKTTKTTLKKLKSKKTYYVRVKAYKTVSKKAVYGAYSAVKNVKVK